MSARAEERVGGARASIDAPGTAARHALESLREALVSGRLAPGDRVLQDDLASSIGVSLAPVREALAVLEQEGQLTYRPRRGYFVTRLEARDLREIYELRALLEDRAARQAVPLLDAETLERIEIGARDCVEAAAEHDVAAELEANRRFHFAILEAADQPHTIRLIQLLWDSTETYRALYYSSPHSRGESLLAHDKIIAAIRARDPDRLVAELEDHRQSALRTLESILPPER